jgi:adenosylcobinamide kinase / adenosylcobinamide-phosphate guanylyltransferase
VRCRALRYRHRVSAEPVIGRVILVGGGARSGKSRFALDRARELGGRRVFIATAEALDQEMTDRIERHRMDRGGDFVTIEEPLRLPEVLARVWSDDGVGVGVGAPDVMLVDCLTLWVSNRLVRDATEGELRGDFDRLEAALDERRGHVVLVTNEVGMGLVPQTPLGRAFRDAVGDLHQRLAGRADEIYAAMLGTVLRLAPGPVELMPRRRAGRVSPRTA